MASRRTGRAVQALKLERQIGVAQITALTCEKQQCTGQAAAPPVKNSKWAAVAAADDAGVEGHGRPTGVSALTLSHSTI